MHAWLWFTKISESQRPNTHSIFYWKSTFWMCGWVCWPNVMCCIVSFSSSDVWASLGSAAASGPVLNEMPTHGCNPYSSRFKVSLAQIISDLPFLRCFVRLIILPFVFFHWLWRNESCCHLLIIVQNHFAHVVIVLYAPVNSKARLHAYSACLLAWYHSERAHLYPTFLMFHLSVHEKLLIWKWSV